MSINFRYQPSVAVSGNIGGKVPVVDDVLSSHEQKIYPTTSLDENCIEFEFQTDRNYYLDLRQTYLALKLKIVRGRGYDRDQRSKKGTQRLGKSRREKDGGGGRSSSSRYSCKQHFAFNFFQCWSVHQQSSNLQLWRIVCSQILHFQQLQGSHFWIQRSFALPGVRLWRVSWWKYGSAFVWFFFTRRMKMFSKPDGFMLYGKLEVDFFSTSELVYPNMKVRLRLIRARPNFYMISDNPNVSLGIADCSFYTRRIALKDDYHKKWMDMLANTPV